MLSTFIKTKKFHVKVRTAAFTKCLFSFVLIFLNQIVFFYQFKVDPMPEDKKWLKVTSWLTTVKTTKTTTTTRRTTMTKRMLTETK